MVNTLLWQVRNGLTHKHTTFWDCKWVRDWLTRSVSHHLPRFPSETELWLSYTYNQLDNVHLIGFLFFLYPFLRYLLVLPGVS